MGQRGSLGTSPGGELRKCWGVLRKSAAFVDKSVERREVNSGSLSRAALDEASPRQAVVIAWGCRGCAQAGVRDTQQQFAVSTRPVESHHTTPASECRATIIEPAPCDTLGDAFVCQCHRGGADDEDAAVRAERATSRRRGTRVPTASSRAGGSHGGANGAGNTGADECASKASSTGRTTRGRRKVGEVFGRARRCMEVL